MKRFGIFLLFSFAIICSSCDSEPSSNNGTAGEDITQPADNQSDNAESDTIPEPTKPDCEIEGSVLESNEFWAKDENLIVTVVAAPETNDPDFGESHRILEVYDGNNCEQVLREVLPINRSPDFPYYLSDITYNKVNQLLAIRGFENFYILDLPNKKLSGPLKPKFLNERFSEDAQSGMIKRLEVWENYVIGYAHSMGSFAFDLTDPSSPKALLPSAEFEKEEGLEYNSLFFLAASDEEGGHQIIIPSYDVENDKFNVGALLGKPSQVSTSISKNVRDNRFLVIKENGEDGKSKPLAIDMKAMKRIELPAEYEDKKVSEILAWIKEQAI